LNVTERKVSKHAQYGLKVVLPIEYCRAHRLEPGTGVKLVYSISGPILVVPPDCEKKVEEQWDWSGGVIE